MNKKHKKELKRKAVRVKKKRIEQERRNAWKNKMTGKKPIKKKKEKKKVKPYRITILQKKIERLQEGIRALDHSDPNREKLVKRLQVLKDKLN